MYTMDYVVWPEEYGCGSSGIRSWIERNLKKDKLDASPLDKCASIKPKPFPTHWTPKPQMYVEDYVVWPEAYGCGSSGIRNWIESNLKKDKLDAARPEKCKPGTAWFELEGHCV